jgi:hypothetical protein
MAERHRNRRRPTSDRRVAETWRQTCARQGPRPARRAAARRAANLLRSSLLAQSTMKASMKIEQPRTTQTRAAWQRAASTGMPWEAETEGTRHAEAAMTAAALISMLEHWRFDCCSRHCHAPARQPPVHSLALAAAVALVPEPERPRRRLTRPNRPRPRRAQRARPPSTTGRQCCHYSQPVMMPMRMWTRSTQERSQSRLRLRRHLSMQPTMRAKAPPKGARRNPSVSHRRRTRASEDRAKSDERTRCEARNMVTSEMIEIRQSD